MRRTAAIALTLFALTAAPVAGHGGSRLTSGSSDGLSAVLSGSTLPADQSPDGRARVDYTVAVRAGAERVSDSRVTLAIDRGGGNVERRRGRYTAGGFEVLVDRDDESWRRWPVRMEVQRRGATVTARYEPPDTSSPSWLPYLGVLLVPLLVVAGSRVVRRHREANAPAGAS